jgi:nicotinamide riboside transporter PnuC
MSESESSLTTIGSVLAGILDLFLAMREINIAFFLPQVLTPVFTLVFWVVALTTSVCFGTDLGKLVDDSGLGLGNKTS